MKPTCNQKTGTRPDGKPKYCSNPRKYQIALTKTINEFGDPITIDLCEGHYQEMKKNHPERIKKIIEIY